MASLFILFDKKFTARFLMALKERGVKDFSVFNYLSDGCLALCLFVLGETWDFSLDIFPNPMRLIFGACLSSKQTETTFQRFLFSRLAFIHSPSRMQSIINFDRPFVVRPKSAVFIFLFSCDANEFLISSGWDQWKIALNRDRWKAGKLSPGKGGHCVVRAPPNGIWHRE